MTPSMSFILLLIILVNAYFTYKGLNDPYFFDKYKFNVGAIRRGEYYRLITGSFLHGSWGHFIFNMLTLYFFYPVVEAYLGSYQALLIYFGGMLAGNLTAYYLHQKDTWYSAVGASGAVNAVVFASILLYPEGSIIIFPIPIPIPSYIYAVGYLLYTTFGMKNQLGNIGHEAHFGGAAAGLLLTVMLEPYLWKQRLSLLLVMGAIIVGGFLYARKKN